MKMLEGIRCEPRWITQLACVKSCLDYLQIPMSESWLYGGTGYAFLLNIQKDGGPGGFQAFNTEMIHNLGNNLGYTINGISGMKTDRDFADKQRIAWENTKRALDRGFPSYGYRLGIPEYYTVYGADDEGYYFSGIGTEDAWNWTVSREAALLLDRGIVGDEVRELSERIGVKFSPNVWVERHGGPYMINDDQGNSVTVAGKAFLPWEKLGTDPIGILEMYWVEPGLRSDDRTVVKESLDFALEFAGGPHKWVFAHSRAGLEAYDQWIENFLKEKPNGFGLAGNAEGWVECRMHCSPYLREAEARIGGAASGKLLRAADLFDKIHEHMRAVRDLFPFHGRRPEWLEDKERIGTAVRHLEQAKALEAEALRELERIVDML